ncbi:hypothetical protein DSS3PM1_00066 [Bacteriophage DSS3_PM1]|nr:hypothetical protein DSS3PM1_00066 [Bacteriophage DSS3_PM1]
MAHISTLDSGVFSYLDIFKGNISALPAAPAAGDFAALFNGGAADTVRMPSVREFPAIGNAANITNVPVFGQKQSSQVSGQADAPTMDVTVNYVPSEMEEIETLKKQRVAFRFMMAREEVTVAEGAGVTLSKENTEFYFVGVIEAVQVTPSLTDANTAVVNISIKGDFVGPATIT